MNRYLYRYIVLLTISLNLTYGASVFAKDDCNSLPDTLQMRSDLIVKTASWNDHQPYLGQTSPFSEVLEAGKDQSSGWGYRWEGPPPESPDWHGIKWDTAYFVGLQFAAIAILYVAPESLSGWDKESKDNYSLSKWTENVRNPVWDEDEWYVNYILHPYWGATYYIRAQERGLNRLQSFWYSFLLSTLYEFGAEALFEPVSYQDLIVTPVAGALLGEYVFNPIREWVRAKEKFSWTDKTVLFLTDPLGVVSAGMNQLFGVNTEMSFSPLRISDIPRSSWVLVEEDVSRPNRSHSRSLWGVQLNFSW